ncbi:MAG: NUDIX domain-containing protein [Pseudomonadota bacterium]
MIFALKRALYRFILAPARWMYWIIFHPVTYGAMMLVIDVQANKVLLLRHAYGKRHIWTIPGGGYWSSREDPESAAVREAWEEAGVKVTDIKHLDRLYGNTVSKRDTRHVYVAKLVSQTPIQSAEIEEQRWVSWEEAQALPLSKVAQVAISHCKPDDDS